MAVFWRLVASSSFSSFSLIFWNEVSWSFGLETEISLISWKKFWIDWGRSLILCGMVFWIWIASTYSVLFILFFLRYVFLFFWNENWVIIFDFLKRTWIRRKDRLWERLYFESMFHHLLLSFFSFISRAGIELGYLSFLEKDFALTEKKKKTLIQWEIVFCRWFQICVYSTRISFTMYIFWNFV